jgi:putative lipoic acid-binding regulatory protein
MTPTPPTDHATQPDPRRDSLIEYPCAFPVKVMGLKVDEFAQTMAAIAQRHDPGFDASTLEIRHSKGGNYLGVTLTVQATSRAQLDALYLELTGHPLVKVVL